MKNIYKIRTMKKHKMYNVFFEKLNLKQKL
jgi:hypothetical protein